MRLIARRSKWQRKIVRLIVLRTRDGRVDGSGIGERKSFVVTVGNRSLVLRIVVVGAHGGVTVVGGVSVAVGVAVVGGDAVRRLNIRHNRVFVGVQQTLIQTVADVRVFLHWVVVVVEPRHLHHSDAVVVLRVNVQMLTEAVALVVDSVAVHREADDEEQQQNDANDGENRGVGGRQEVVIHNGVNDDVVVAVAIRSENAVVAS